MVGINHSAGATFKFKWPQVTVYDPRSDIQALWYANGYRHFYTHI